MDILEHDKSNLLAITDGLPEDSILAFENAKSINLTSEYKKVKNIVISAMGGSCISANLLKSYLWEKSKIPIFINKSMNLPHFVNSNSLCIFISYSGNTRETIDSAKEAIKKNALCVSITNGGELKEISLENKFVTVNLNSKPKMPRAAVGEIFYSLLGLLSQIKSLNISIREVKNTFKPLKKIRDNYSINKKKKNAIFDIAKESLGKKLVIFGVTPFTEAVALRWKNQFNENSKEVVLYNSFPELCHNEIVGLSKVNLDDYIFLVLRDSSESDILKKQIDVTLEMFKNANIKSIYSEGKSLLERQIKLLYIGDYISIYSAILKEIDPSPIDAISELKKRMNF